jgi:hypothetical protein
MALANNEDGAIVFSLLMLIINCLLTLKESHNLVKFLKQKNPICRANTTVSKQMHCLNYLHETLARLTVGSFLLLLPTSRSHTAVKQNIFSPSDELSTLCKVSCYRWVFLGCL